MNVPGKLGLTELAMLTGLSHDQRAKFYRPTDPRLIIDEIARLAASGLTARDISDALSLDIVQVLEALGGREAAS